MNTKVEKVSDLIPLLQNEEHPSFELSGGRFNICRVLTDHNPAGDLGFRAENLLAVKGSVYTTYSQKSCREMAVQVGNEGLETYGIIDEMRLRGYVPQKGDGDNVVRIPVRGGNILISKSEE